MATNRLFLLKLNLCLLDRNINPANDKQANEVRKNKVADEEKYERTILLRIGTIDPVIIARNAMIMPFDSVFTLIPELEMLSQLINLIVITKDCDTING